MQSHLGKATRSGAPSSCALSTLAAGRESAIAPSGSGASEHVQESSSCRKKGLPPPSLPQEAFGYPKPWTHTRLTGAGLHFSEVTFLG